MSLGRGASGAPVLSLQHSLIVLGYRLPRWGVDGVLGDETMMALAHFLADHGRTPAEVPGEVTDTDLELVASLVRTMERPPPRYVDVRYLADRRQIRGIRPWSAVTGIVLHQTACVLGERADRWATIGAHIGVTRGGQAIQIHEPTTLVWHGNGFNASTVGIECDGCYAGIEGDLETFWRPKTEPNRMPQVVTAEQVEAARAAIRWVVAEVARHGGRVRHLFAHRQASADRQSDPGSALWQRVAMPMHEELGLSDGGPGYRVGSGLAIPEQWDETRRGVRY